MQNMSIAISVVAPCYNEEGCLKEFVSRVHGVCKSISSSYEIVLVDDGSSDSTWKKIEEERAVDDRVVGIKLSRNHGHQIALTAGLNYASGELILIIDADLQDPPELLPKMMVIMEENGADVVYGQRAKRDGESDFKIFTAFAFYRVLNYLAEISIPNDVGDFRLMTRRSLSVLLSMNEQYRFIRGMVSWIGFRQVPMMYDRDQRYAGETKYPLVKMIRFAINAITSFSIKPLRMASYFGFVFAGLSMLMMFYFVLSYFFGFSKPVPGWTSIVVILLMFASIQLFVLGIMGEYLGRLSMESKKRPLFIVEKIAGEINAEKIKN